MDDIIDGYNQMIDNIQQIVEKFQFHYTFTNNHNEQITFRYKFLSQGRSVIANREELIACQKLTERKNSDFQLRFVFDMVFLINDYQIPKVYTFTLTIPVITGVKYDPITTMTPKQRWDEGLNTSYTGGNIILSGVKYLLPRIFSYPMNKPIIVKANKKHQLVRCEYIKQDDVFYGNSYHTFYAITDYHDIVINFRQSFDTRLLPQKAAKLIFVPVILMFYAYGIKTDEEILRLCNPNKDQQLELFLIVHFRASNQPHMSQDEAKQAIAKLILKPEFYNDIDDILNKYIYPLNEADIYPYQLGEIVQIMYKVYLNQELAQDKMDLTNKRIKTVPLQFITEFRSKMQETYKKEMSNLQFYIQDVKLQDIINTQGVNIDNSLQGYIKNLQDHLESTVKKSFTSVNSLNTTSTLKKVQDENKSKILTIQQIKEIVIRQEGPVKVPFDRCRVHLSYFGLIDTIQSPESGAEVGRYLSPNMYTYTTSAYDDKDIIKFIKPYLQQYGAYTMPVKVNYKIIGFIHWDKFKGLYNKLMQIRRPFISVFYNILDQQLCVCTDIGRLMTPIVAPDVSAKELATIPFATLIEEKKVIYVCAEMMQNFIIKQWTDHDCSTYRFLPSGLVAAFNAINPFCINMKSCRSSLFTSQGKQAIQQPLSNHMTDCSSSQLYAHFLQYGPTDTEIQRTVYEKFPIGNLGYATFIQTAFNQEDAMIVNEGYLKRNALSTSEYRSFDTSIQNRGEKFGVGDDDKGSIIDNPHFMADQIGLRVEYGTPLIGKLTQLKKFSNQWLDYKTVKYPYNYQCQFAAVSNVIKSSLSPYAQTKIVRVELRRYPMVGDKLISKNCQKGCIGKILKEYEMPINSIGVVSSFLLSGQSILKRETYGQAIEPIHNKWLAETGQLIANVSMDNPIPNIQKLMSVQNDTVYGIENHLLSGPMIFSSQCHLVSRKIRARNTGEIDALSRQPASGKKHNGGIRQGNMEEIALESQGISGVIKNQTGVNSSNTRWYYCRQCNGDQVYYNITDRSYYCPTCGKLDNKQVGNGSYNYSEQIISQTLYSIGVGMKIYE